MNTIQRWMLAAVTVCFTLPAMAQDQNAWGHANDNAEFLRCGTRTPSEIERLAIEEWLLDLRQARTKAQGKKPPWAGGGGGIGSAAGGPGFRNARSCTVSDADVTLGASSSA